MQKTKVAPVITSEKPPGFEKKPHADTSFSFDKKPTPLKEFTIDSELTRQLKILSQNEDATIFTTMLGMLDVLFYRYNNDDVCVGISGPHKKPAEGERLGIPFNHLELVKNKLCAENSFTELLNEIKITANKASEHEPSI